MTDSKALIARVREALAKATPGPWTHSVWDDPQHVVQHSKGFICSTNQGNDVANAELIAHAPDWLAALCDALEACPEPLPRKPSTAAWKAALAALGDNPALALMEDPSSIAVALQAAYAAERGGSKG